jgi:WD40 repeat protein
MGFKKQQKGEQMKRAIFFISAIIILCSFSSQLLALPEGAVARLGKGRVKAVTFSPVGTVLAVACYYGIYLYDAKTLAEIDFPDTNAEMTSVAFNFDGSILASGSSDKTIKLWDVKSRSLITTLAGHTDWVHSVSFSPDGLLLASGSSDKTIKLWDVKSRSLITTLAGHTDRVNSVSFSPDGSILASGSEDDTIKLWDVKNRSLITTLTGINMVNSVSFSSDGSILASGNGMLTGSSGDSGGDVSINLWDVKSKSLITTLSGQTYPVYSVSFSPDGSLLASGNFDNTIRLYTIKLWDVKSRSLITTLEGHTEDVESISFSPDGSILASASYKEIKLWDVKSRSLITTLAGHTDRVNSVSFSPDGSILASGGDDVTIKLWDVKNRSLITTLAGHTDQVNSVSFSPDGSFLASGGGYRDKTINLWDVKSRSLVTTLAGDTHRVDSVSFSPDGSILASGSFDRTIKLWDVKSASLITTLEGHTHPVNSVSLSPDGSLLASGSYDNTIKLWDVKSRSLITTITTLSGHAGYMMSVSFSPDGSILASGSGDYTPRNAPIKLWDVKSASLITTLSGHTDRVYSVSFSPDGSILASGSEDNTIKLWDVKNRSLITTLAGYAGSRSVSFSPDGSLLASGSGGTIILWDMKPYIQRPVDNVSKLREIINVRLLQRPIYPPYLLDTDSFLSATNTIWQNFTDWFRRNDLTDNYEELYYTGIEYDNMRFGALIKARDFLDKGDVANAKRFLDKADTYEKMSIMSFQGASYVFEANLEAAKVIAQSIKDGCQASVKFGLKFVNPTAAEVADWVYDVVDLGIEYYIGDKEQAVKDFILKRSVSIVFDKLGDQTMSDWSKNRAGKYLFPQLSKFIKSEEWQWALSKVIKEGVSSISEETLTKMIKFTVNEADKTMNYVDAKP